MFRKHASFFFQAHFSSLYIFSKHSYFSSKSSNRAEWLNPWLDLLVLIFASLWSISSVVRTGTRGKWISSNRGWIKINADGATSKDTTWAAAVGVLRDSNGRWITGFQRHVGSGTTLSSELWAILHGLQIAKLRGYLKIEIESDCLMALDLIQACLDGAQANTIVKEITCTIR